mgnify:CR=1 FL=1
MPLELQGRSRWVAGWDAGWYCRSPRRCRPQRRCPPWRHPTLALLTHPTTPTDCDIVCADVAAVDGGFDTHNIPYDVLWLDIEHTNGAPRGSSSSVRLPSYGGACTAANGHPIALALLRQHLPSHGRTRTPAACTLLKAGRLRSSRHVTTPPWPPRPRPAAHPHPHHHTTNRHAVLGTKPTSYTQKSSSFPPPPPHQQASVTSLGTKPTSPRQRACRRTWPRVAAR